MDPVALCERAEDQSCLARLGAFDELLAILDRLASGDSPAAASASSRALRLRLDLGRIEDIGPLGQRFAARFPRHPLLAEVAETMFFVAEELLERSQLDAAARSYREYLGHWATLAPDERLLEAHVRLAEILLRKSCPAGGIFGACVRLHYVRGRCSAETYAYYRLYPNEWICKKDIDALSARIRWAKATLVQRRPALLREAQAHLRAAGTMWSRIGLRAKADAAAHPSEEARDFAAHALLLGAYSDVEFLLSLNDGLAHEGYWGSTRHRALLAHRESLDRIQQAAEAIASPAGMNEVRAHVALWSLLASWSTDTAFEREFCRHPIHIGQFMGLAPSLEECLDASRAPVWSRWNAACEALAQADLGGTRGITEIVPIASYPQSPPAPAWSPPWGLLATGLRRPEIMWFLETVLGQPELPFAWEFRDGVALPPPYPPMPARRPDW